MPEADPRLFRPRDRAGAVGPRTGRRSSTTNRRRSSACSTRRSTASRRQSTTISTRPSAALRRSTRSTRIVYADRQQRRLPRGFASEPGGLRGRGRGRCSTRSMRWRSAWRGRAISSATALTEADWRLFTTLVRFDAVYLRPLQVQPAADRRLPEPVGLSARSLPAPGIADTVTSTTSSATTTGATRHQPDPHRADRARLDLQRARPRSRSVPPQPYPTPQ